MAKIGLLGLYLELYDIRSPGMREKIDGFYENIALEFEKRGIDIIRQPICRLEDEFKTAVKTFESSGADALVTLHLAYSPSLESSDVLMGTALPIYILNTTPDYDFRVDEEYNAISYNHGIHGVQDMCNLLLRNGREFAIETGHWRESDAIDRLCRRILKKDDKSAMTDSVAAPDFSGKLVRVGIIGKPFEGMGDFRVGFSELHKKLGIEVVECDHKLLKEFIAGVSNDEIEDEIRHNRMEFDDRLTESDAYAANLRSCLGVRKWIEDQELDAFTVNFLDVDKNKGLASVPFYEASKQMSSGRGYAGEGDAMTAGLVAMLMRITNDVSFTEIFCPDWSADTLFLSHMGEMNIDLCKENPVLHEKDYVFSDVEVNPVVFSGEFKPGNAHLVNISPSKGGGFTLIIAPVAMVSTNKVKNGVRGWMKPQMPIEEFLSRYSSYGGTHHSALVYGDFSDEILTLGRYLGCRIVNLS